MPLITPEDVQTKLNVDLTSPEGQAVATSLIDAAVAWVEGQVGYPLESASLTTYFSDGYCHFWLPTSAPVSDLILSTYNPYTSGYDTVDARYVRFSPTGEIDCLASLPSGFQAVKASYTAGWTAITLPADFKDALVDLVGIRLLEVANFASATTITDADGNEVSSTPVGALKKVQSDSYTEEYSTAQTDAYWKGKAAQLSRSIGDSVPSGIMETLSRFKRPFAL